MSLEVKRHDFVRKKYDREFLMDCVFFSEADRKVTIGHPFCFSFHGIFIQNAGQATISIANDIFQLDKGAFIFLRANEVREWISVTPDFSGYLLIFENEFIQTFFNDNLFLYRFQFFQTNQPPVLPCDEAFLSEHTGICVKIQSELDQLQDDSHHLIRSLLYNILIQINRRYIEVHQLSSELYNDSISLQFLKSLEENIRKKQRVEEYAQLLQISRSQLNKALIKTSNKSTSTIIRERLLTEIKRDLLYSDRNISEIAFELGFSDTSNFTRFFKQYMQLTPKDFRSLNSK